MRSRTLVALLALLFALPALAQDRRPPAPPLPIPVAVAPPAPAAKAPVTKVFNVAELVGPESSLDGEKAIAAYRANTEKLVKLVTDMVRPYSWSAAGGTGKAEYFDLGTALVVTNSADVIAEVADLLEALRKLGALSLTYEVRLVRAPVGTFERAGVRADRDTVLTKEQLRAVLEAGQSDREASITQFPRLTAGNGESVTAKCGDTRTFVTGVDATKVHGSTVLVPKQTAVHLGETATIKGVVSADRGHVRVEAAVAHTRLVGKVELISVTKQITPVFEGGSQGQPVPFTQFIQAPDVRKECAERVAVVPNGGTIVIGSWKQLAEPQGKGKASQEVEVLALATVRVAFDPDLAQKKLVAPAARYMEAHKLRNIAAADAQHALAAHFKGSDVALVVEPVSNTLLVSGSKETTAKIAKLVAEMDKAVPQVLVQATIVEVPDGFLEGSGLKPESDTGGVSSYLLTPRETQMFTALLRAAKEKGECDVLSRPQIQVGDNQTGCVSIGQQYPVTGAGGKVELKPIGIALRVTPRITPDGKSVYLATEAQHTSVRVQAVIAGMKVSLLPGTLFPIPTFATLSPVFNEQQVKSNAQVPFGHTFVTGLSTRVMRNTINPATGVRSEEVACVQKLIILTPHPIHSHAEVVPAGLFSK